jgi:hypothetical protein
MAKAGRWGSRVLSAALTGLPLLLAAPASGQETPGQFNAANAENRRHTEAENRLRNEALELRQDRAKALLQCQGAGSVVARNACAGHVDIDTRQRGLDLNNQAIREQNNHNLILKGIGVRRVP